MTEAKRIGAAIAAWRKKHGLTRSALATRFGTNRSAIGCIERGEPGRAFSKVRSRIAASLKVAP